MTRRHYDPVTGKVYRTSDGKFGRCIDENPGVPCCDLGGTSLNEAGNQPPPFSSSLWGIIVGGPWDGFPMELAYTGPGAVWTGSPLAGGVDCGLGTLHKPTFTVACGTGTNAHRFIVTSALAGTTVTQPDHSIQSISCFCDTLTVDYGPFISGNLGDCASFSWSIKILCTEICLFTLNGEIPTGFDVTLSGMTDNGPVCNNCVDADGIYDTSTLLVGEEPCTSWRSALVEFTCHTTGPLLRDARSAVVFSTSGVQYGLLTSFTIFSKTPSTTGSASYQDFSNSPYDLSATLVPGITSQSGECLFPATVSTAAQ